MSRWQVSQEIRWKILGGKVLLTEGNVACIEAYIQQQILNGLLRLLIVCAFSFLTQNHGWIWRWWMHLVLNILDLLLASLVPSSIFLYQFIQALTISLHLSLLISFFFVIALLFDYSLAWYLKPFVVCMFSSVWSHCAFVCSRTNTLIHNCKANLSFQLLYVFDCHIFLLVNLATFPV